MKPIQTLLPALLLLAAACSDRDAELPFAGTDNSVTSFVLTTLSGERYEAALTRDRIVVTVPETCTLDGAQATYTICEQAVLYPEPAGISDWDNEHRFRVVAYNETLRDYLYTVVRTPVASDGSVVLLTQADVEAFGAAGITTVAGSLVLGDLSAASDDPITDLSPLSGLTEVRYDIVVNRSFAGESLHGLENVVRAGGLTIGTPVAATTLANGLAVALPALESLGEVQINCADLVSLQLPKLRRVGQFYVDAASLALVELPQLAVCDGYFVLKSTANNTLLNTLALPALTRVRSMLTVEKLTKLQRLELPQLEAVDGAVSLQTLSALEGLSLPLLTQCAGLTANALNRTEAFDFPALTRVGGTFSIAGSTSSSACAAINLPLLERVDGDLTVNQAAGFETFALPALTTVGGELNLRYLRNVTRLELPKLASVGTRICLYYLSGITQLDISGVADLPKLELVGCEQLETLLAAERLHDVTFNGANVQNTSWPRFARPTVIGGTLTLTGYRYTARTAAALQNVVEVGTFATSLSGSQGAFLEAEFPDLERMGSFTLSSAYWLASLSFPKLKEVTGKLDLQYTSYMADGGLRIPALRAIGELVFNGSTYAAGAKSFTLRTSLADFAEVERIGRLTVKWWGALRDFSGLARAAASVPEGNWDISGNVLNGGSTGYNPTKQDILDGKYYAE